MSRLRDVLEIEMDQEGSRHAAAIRDLESQIERGLPPSRSQLEADLDSEQVRTGFDLAAGTDRQHHVSEKPVRPRQVCGPCHPDLSGVHRLVGAGPGLWSTWRSTGRHHRATTCSDARGAGKQAVVRNLGLLGFAQVTAQALNLAALVFLAPPSGRRRLRAGPGGGGRLRLRHDHRRVGPFFPGCPRYRALAPVPRTFSLTHAASKDCFAPGDCVLVAGVVSTPPGFHSTSWTRPCSGSTCSLIVPQVLMQEWIATGLERMAWVGPGQDSASLIYADGRGAGDPSPGRGDGWPAARWIPLLYLLSYGRRDSSSPGRSAASSGDGSIRSLPHRGPCCGIAEGNGSHRRLHRDHAGADQRRPYHARHFVAAERRGIYAASAKIGFCGGGHGGAAGRRYCHGCARRKDAASTKGFQPAFTFYFGLVLAGLIAAAVPAFWPDRN